MQVLPVVLKSTPLMGKEDVVWSISGTDVKPRKFVIPWSSPKLKALFWCTSSVYLALDIVNGASNPMGSTVWGRLPTHTLEWYRSSGVSTDVTLRESRTRPEQQFDAMPLNSGMPGSLSLISTAQSSAWRLHTQSCTAREHYVHII